MQTIKILNTKFEKVTDNLFKYEDHNFIKLWYASKPQSIKILNKETNAVTTWRIRLSYIERN